MLKTRILTEAAEPKLWEKANNFVKDYQGLIIIGLVVVVLIGFYIHRKNKK